MQTIKAQVVINIPETHTLIEKVELEELKQKAESEWASGIGWLSDQTGIKSPQKLKENLLYPYRDELETFVAYPETQGGNWRFNKTPMKQWLRGNFRKVVN